MSNLPSLLSWKFNNQPGMRCKEIDGVMTIIDFPGGIPTQAEIDTWTAEYEAAGGDAEMERERKADVSKVDPFLKALVLALNDGSLVPGSNYTNQQLKQIIKSKL